VEEFKVLDRKRHARQFFMGITFIAIMIAGWFYPLLGYFVPLCMILGMGVALFQGRKWCDWWCPRGSFSDAWARIISLRKEIPPVFKGFPFRIAAFLLLMSLVAVNLKLRWSDPYKIGMFFMLMLTTTTALGIFLTLIIHQRCWCTFCPIGTASNWIGKNKYPLKIDSQNCIDCKLCGGVCPIQIKPYAFKKSGVEIVKGGDCLKCNLCISVCPKKALSR